MKAPFLPSTIVRCGFGNLTCAVGAYHNSGRDRDSCKIWITSQQSEPILSNCRFVEGKLRHALEERTVFQRENFSWKAVLSALEQPGIFPDSSIYASLLRWCGNSHVLWGSKRVHLHIIESGLEQDIMLGSLLVEMYGKCGALEDAISVFSTVHQRNVFTWNSIIRVYTQQGQGSDAFELFEQMQGEGVQPDKVTFVSVLAVCSGHAELAQGKRMHDSILHSGFEKSVVVGTALLSMYGKCGSPADARTAFDAMLMRDAIAWNAILAVYAQHDQSEEALVLFYQMQQEGFLPDKVTFISVVDACASQMALADGERLHAWIVYHGFESDEVTRTALANVYGKCGSLDRAETMFVKGPRFSVVSWTTMIALYAQHGHGKKTVQLYNQMGQEGLIPDKVTFASIFAACACNGMLAEGKRMHAGIVNFKFESDVIVGTALVSMYGKCSSLNDAQRMFDIMPEKNVLTWNALIAAYSQHGQAKTAFQLFEHMQQLGVVPDKATVISILDARASHATLSNSKQIHARILDGRLKSDVVLDTALVNLYGKCGCFDDALKLFHKMPVQNLFSWNSMMAVYVYTGKGKEALQLYNCMLQEAVMPDKVTFVITFSACASENTLIEGKKIHACVLDREFESHLGNVIVNMYGKCGDIEGAQEVFDKILNRNLVSWNAMIAAHAQHGKGKNAVKLFQNMQQGGIMPNEVTFTSVLASCSHAGLVDEGCHFFDFMSSVYGIFPVVDHYICMIDLLGRAGCLHEAEIIIDGMPFQPTFVSLIALISACRHQVDLDRGERAAERVLELDSDTCTTEILLSYLHGAAGCELDV